MSTAVLGVLKNRTLEGVWVAVKSTFKGDFGYRC